MKKALVVLVVVLVTAFAVDLVFRLIGNSEEVDAIPSPADSSAQSNSSAAKAQVSVSGKGEVLSVLTKDECTDLGKKLLKTAPKDWDLKDFEKVFKEPQLAELMSMLIQDYASCKAVELDQLQGCDIAKQISLRFPSFTDCYSIYLVMYASKHFILEGMSLERLEVGLVDYPKETREWIMRFAKIYSERNLEACSSLEGSQFGRVVCQMLVDKNAPEPSAESLKAVWAMCRVVDSKGADEQLISKITTLYPAVLLATVMGKKGPCDTYFETNWDYMCQGKSQLAPK